MLRCPYCENNSQFSIQYFSLRREHYYCSLECKADGDGDSDEDDG